MQGKMVCCAVWLGGPARLGLAALRASLPSCAGIGRADADAFICSDCRDDLCIRRPRMPKFALANDFWIGREHPLPALEECAVVQASYRTADGARGEVALIGPMRMAYATARAAVQSVATILQRLLS